MELDKFLKSQTFKTGVFVLFVLFVLLFVFKMGVFYGFKKANFSHGYGATYHRTVGSPMFGNQRGAIFNHKRSTVNKDLYKGIILKKQLIKNKATVDSTTEDEPASKEIAE